MLFGVITKSKFTDKKKENTVNLNKLYPNNVQSSDPNKTAILLLICLQTIVFATLVTKLFNTEWVSIVFPAAVVISAITLIVHAYRESLTYFNLKLWLVLNVAALTIVIYGSTNGYVNDIEKHAEFAVGSANLLIAIFCGAVAVYGHDREPMSLRAQVYVVGTYFYAGLIGVLTLFRTIFWSYDKFINNYEFVFAIASAVVVAIALFDASKAIYDKWTGKRLKLDFEMFCLIVALLVLVFNLLTFSYWDETTKIANSILGG